MQLKARVASVPRKTRGAKLDKSRSVTAKGSSARFDASTDAITATAGRKRPGEPREDSGKPDRSTAKRSKQAAETISRSASQPPRRVHKAPFSIDPTKLAAGPDMSWRTDPRLQSLQDDCRKEMRTYAQEATAPGDVLCTDEPYVCDVISCNTVAVNEAGLIQHCQEVSHLATLERVHRGTTPSPHALLKLPADSSEHRIRTRYKAVIRRWHTDHCTFPGASLHATLLTQAYNQLKWP